MWSPDGRELFYVGSVVTGLMAAQIETEPVFGSTTPESLFGLGGFAVNDFGGRNVDLAPDGDRFIFLRPEAATQTSDDEPFNGLIFVENWFEELKARVPVP